MALLKRQVLLVEIVLPVLVASSALNAIVLS